MAADAPDVSNLDGVVAEPILTAMRKTSERLTQLGIRHALVGGLAVGAHGYPRATKDVDWLVGNEAFQLHEGGGVSMAPGVPIQFEGVAVDQLSIGDREQHLIEALQRAKVSNGIPVAPMEALVYLKIKSPRRKDAVDIVEFLRVRHLEIDAVRNYVRTHAPNLLPKLEALVEDATGEEEE